MTIRAALESVSLPSDDEFLRKYPSQMSVGQAQRVLIAMAVMHRPALLIADEATSALDVITQSEILALFRSLNRSTGMAILYISHDLASVAGICDRIAILHRGRNRGAGHSAASPHRPSTRIHAPPDGGDATNAAVTKKRGWRGGAVGDTAASATLPPPGPIAAIRISNPFAQTEVTSQTRDRLSHARLSGTDWPNPGLLTPGKPH